MVHFMVTYLYGGYTCFMIGIYVVYSSGYSFLTLCRLNCCAWLHIVELGKVGFCEMFSKRGT